MTKKSAYDHNQSMVDVPVKYTAKYSAGDKAKVKRIIGWINKGQHHEPGFANQRSQTKLAAASNVNHTTLNTILRGKYPSSPTKHLDKIQDAIRLWDKNRNESHECPFIETSVFSMVQAACYRAHKYRSFAVVSAYVGTGKTRAIKEYVRHHDNIVLVSGTPDMNSSVLLTNLVQQTGAVVHKTNNYSDGTKAEKMAAVVESFRLSGKLIVIDEAETVSPATLEYVRRISDIAEIGVVLTGTEKLKPMVKDPRGRFGQISSRVCFWPPVIKSITEDDAYQLTRAMFNTKPYKKTKLNADVLDAFWQMSGGSARMLVQNIIPGVLDYGIKKGSKLTPELVYRITQKALGFSKPRRGE